jgi:23S rRNA pseudouridine1911/1915/1917 synthase
MSVQELPNPNSPPGELEASLTPNLHIQRSPKTRLDHYLAKLYPDISRAFLQKLCNTNQVLVNGNPEKSGFKLKPQDIVEILYHMDAIEKIEDIELPVLFQDDNILVINKPAGVISHSRGKFWNEPSVASFIRQLTNQNGDRAGIVHRLDRATSGVMVCAKNEATMAILQKQFADRKVKKEYVAIIKGHLQPPEAVIDMPIERNPKAPSTFKVGSNGKPAQTKYKLVQSSGLYDEVELIPKTGRTHQLRVHLQYQGHPIVGDILYKGPEADRLYLHAHRITINTPTYQNAVFTAPIPQEFSTIMQR